MARALQLKRTHFHDFMLDVHRRLRGVSNQSDPLAQVAADISESIKVRLSRATRHPFPTPPAPPPPLLTHTIPPWARGVTAPTLSGVMPPRHEP